MKRQGLFRILLGVLLVAAIAVAFLYREQLDGAQLEQWLADAGGAAPLLFIALYAVATVLFLPGSVLTLVGGALFGPVWGTLYNLTGATIGAGLSFLAARTLVSDWVAQRAGRRMMQLISGVEAEGWRFIAFVRLVPLFPFNLLNYALGLTRIPFWTYLIATWLFMIPGAIAYTWLGYAGKEAASGGASMVQNGLIALALLAVVMLLPRLVARVRQGKQISIAELSEQLKDTHPPLVLDVRTEADFDGELGHIHNALNIPLEDLKQRLEELESWRERSIMLVCTTDRRSVRAALLLVQQGFTEVHVVAGGMTQWNRDGLPTQR